MERQYPCLQVHATDGVTVVTIDAPPLNHFGLQLARDIVALCADIRRSPDVRVVVFQSDVDGFFVPHLDLNDIDKLPTPPAPMRDFGLRMMRALAHAGPVARKLNHFSLNLLSPFHAALDAVWNLPQMTIAVIEGRVGGLGSEFALCLDMRFADRERAVLNQLEAAFGLFPGAGGTQRLTALLGAGRAHEIIAASNDIDAETAERWGYYNRALSSGEVRPFALDLARRIARHPLRGVRTGKRLVRMAQPLNEKALQVEAVAFMQGMFTGEVRERLNAFLEAGGQQRAGAARLPQSLP